MELSRLEKKVCRRAKLKKLGNLIVISGPSGVGKSTLVKKARQALPDLQFSVSCTTRQPRAGESHGKEYFFLSDEEFCKHLDNGDFLEHAQVFRHRYGTLCSEVIARLERGEEVVLDIDVQGAGQIRKAAENNPLIAAASQFIIIAPPDVETLAQRLAGRNSETPEQLKLRLDGALNELSHFRMYDYMVINDDLETAAAELISLLRSIRLRTATITGEPFK